MKISTTILYSLFGLMIQMNASERETKLVAAEQLSKTVFPAVHYLTKIWAETIQTHGLEKEFTPLIAPIVRVLAGKTLSLEETQHKLIVPLVLLEESPWCGRLHYIKNNHYDYLIACGICNAVDTWRKYSIDSVD